MAVRLAIIGGTGIYNPKMLADMRTFEVNTRYGAALLSQGSYQGQEVIFMARHGTKHSLPPHKINYRANIAALLKVGVEKVVATAAVGSLNDNMPPGAIVLLEQFLDFTKGREATFFDGGEAGVVHTDFTAPYCPEINKLLLSAAKRAALVLQGGAVYVCTEGPRFETPAEIRMFQQFGGDLVGMTNVPEVVLAREAGLCYSTLALSTNFAAGISPAVLTHHEVLAMMGEHGEKVRRLLTEALPALAGTRNCRCQSLGCSVPI